MAEELREKLSPDAKLLADAVIELNLWRRSLGIYPPEHPVIKNAIERASQNLEKLFEIRASITLGITKDALIVDEITLDRGNLVFKEFAKTLHAKAISAITFSAGLNEAELLRFLELITAKGGPTGNELAELAQKDMEHVAFIPIDMNNFFFIEGTQRDAAAGEGIWENYVQGILEGRLFGVDGPGILSVPVETVADAVNACLSEKSGEESYDRVITAYLGKKDEARMSREAFDKFFSFLDRIRPEIKRQLLTRTGARLSADIGKVENIFSEMTIESFQKVADLLTKHASFIPSTLKNLIDKLAAIKQMKTSHFDFFYQQSAVLDDIEISDDVITLFGEDHFHAYVNKQYQQELEHMLAAKTSDRSTVNLFSKECEEEVIDSVALDIMLELLYADFITSADYLTIVTKLSDFMNLFVDTGRFEEILQAYNTLSSHALSGKFTHEASSTVEYFFHSPEFISRLVTAFNLWGRREREGAVRLARALRRSVTDPLLDTLTDEQDPSMRKFLLSLLEGIGSDVVPSAVKRLDDDRWYVTRNMISLIRNCNGKKEVEKIRKFIKHQNIEVRIETLRTLLFFGTPDAVPYLKACLQSEEPGMRQGAIKLAGNFRVREAVPHLITLVSKRDLFGAGASYKRDIVRSLGEIGDSQAIDALLKIYRTWSLFNRKNLAELKVEIFRNLQNYSPEAVRKLIDVGRNAKNDEIRSLCEKGLRQS